MIGRKISHYRIDAEIGRGGMGVVYRAHDERLERDVALKLLPENLAAHSRRRARLFAEARAASTLNHPRIITIFDIGEEGDQIFIAMELVKGRSLRDILLHDHTAIEECVRLGIQLAEALGAAAEAHLVHGDIKPENIIVQPDGRLKLLDFGIARQVSATAAKSSDFTAEFLPKEVSNTITRIAGTLGYMAPERLRGEVVDSRADLFSLGIVVYELAAGRPPFVAPSSAELAAQILSDPAPPLCTTATSIPLELGRIVEKLLQKDPKDRYQSARELQADLGNLLRELEFGGAIHATVQGKRTVAVLPFSLLTPHPEDDYLRIALADAVINQLAATGEFLVRPTSSIAKYASQTINPLIAARELNVLVIVDGSIQKMGARLRVHLQARDAASGDTILSIKEDCDVSDLFGLQDRISAKLATALGASNAPGRAPATPPTKNPRAYELYLRANERMSRLNRWDIQTAIQMFEAATEMDPTFADAWARQAEACCFMMVTWDPKPELIRKAQASVTRALRLDRDNAQAYSTMGRLLWSPARKFQHRAALRSLGRAISLNPGSSVPRLWQAVVMFHVGYMKEARERMKPILATSPDDPNVLWFTGHVASFLGDYHEADRYFSWTLKVDPSHFLANQFAASIPLMSGNLDEAERRIESSVRRFGPDPLTTGYEALLWARRGDEARTMDAAKRANPGKKVLVITHHVWHSLAAAMALLEKPARAMRYLEKSIETGFPNYPVYRDDPDLAPLATHKPFARRMIELKREWEGYKGTFTQG